VEDQRRTIRIAKIGEGGFHVDLTEKEIDQIGHALARKGVFIIDIQSGNPIEREKWYEEA
jgi:hypothetical protein